MTFFIRCLAIALLSFLLPCHAQSNNDDEKILYFDSNIVINKDASIDVTENISVYAHQNKIIHGIVRRLPVNITDSEGVKHHANYKIQQILFNNQSAEYHAQFVSDQYEIYIGNKNVALAPGIYTYTIQYHTDNAIDFLRDEDEFYWNVTGNDWDFPIIKVEAAVRLPSGTHILNSAGYTGLKDKKEQFFYAREEGNGEMSFVTTQPLAPGEGFTVAVSWPKGVISQPTMAQQLEETNRSTLILLIILLAALLYYITVWNQCARGRRPLSTTEQRSTPPENISPAAARFIHLMGFDNKTFTTAIVSMASKGYLVINDEKGFFTLIKQDKDINVLADEEKALANTLFANNSSVQVNKSNFSVMYKARKALRDSLKKQYQNNYFVTNAKYLVPGWILTIAAFVVAAAFADDVWNAAFSLVWLVFWTFGCFYLGRLVVAAIVNAAKNPSLGTLGLAVFLSLFSLPFLLGEILGLFLVSNLVPFITFPCLLLLTTLNFVFYYLLKAPTPAGKYVMEQINGFQQYLAWSEPDRADSSTIESVSNNMPYAIALDAEDPWGQRMDIMLRDAGIPPSQYFPPKWYKCGRPWRSLTQATFPAAIARNLGASLSHASTASRGGGSSGGGSGGGGGGGW
jgi:uncharacterized membrane protein